MTNSLPTFQGAWPALVTPFTADDQVNYSVIEQLVDFMLGKGVSGLYLNGSTGEGMFMTVAEREKILETVMARVNGRVPVIVHVAAAALKDAEHMASHAQDHGASAISSILPPVLYNGAGLTPYFERVAAAAPKIPFMPYIFGGPRDAVAMMKDLLHIPNLGGTKYTGPNMHELNQISRLRSEGWTVFAGMDEQALFGLMFGARGNIGSTVNVMPAAYRRLFELHRAGDYAQALVLQHQVNRVTEVLLRLGFHGAFKTLLGWMGFECGNPRTPNMPMPADKHPLLREQLKAAGWDEVSAL